MVTFDDAYRDFAEIAWPTLQRLGLPVTLFVPTGYPDHPERAFWWDRLHAGLVRSRRTAPLETPLGPLPIGTSDDRNMTFRRLRDYVKKVPNDDARRTVDELCRQLEASPPAPAVLGWEELRRLARAGVTLAPHSRLHPMLNRLSVEEARSEVEGSIEDLVREVGSAAAVFAYPSGQYDGRVVEVVRGAGFDAAFTTERGTNDLATADRLRLRRINVGRRSTLSVLRMQLLPAAARLDRSKAAAGTP
jgi:peptidoglycan/xylan/chitin deacetylase (PgdA/CDA1 family)